MKNSLVLLAVVLSVAAFAGMMRIKTDVQTMDRERLKLVKERAELRETKRVLEAEWALLASPDRLQRLVAGKGYVGASSLDVVPLNSGVSVTAVVTATVAVNAAAIVSEAVAEMKVEQRSGGVVSDTDADAGADMGDVSGTEPLLKGAED
jgi:hypothetical protein